MGKGQGKGQSRDGESCAVRPNRPHVANTVLKDNDLVFKLRLGGDTAAQLSHQLRADADFLEAMRVMDYSLLVGVHNRRFRVDAAAAGGAIDDDEPPGTAAAGATAPVPFFRADGGGLNAQVIEGPGTYYLGIIDILQDWSFIKKVERALKRFLLCHDAGGISVMPPSDYADRFRRRVIEAIFERAADDDLASPAPRPLPRAGGSLHAAPPPAHARESFRIENLRRGLVAAIAGTDVDDEVLPSASTAARRAAAHRARLHAKADGTSSPVVMLHNPAADPARWDDMRRQQQQAV